MAWNDEATTIMEIKDKINRFNAERGWSRYHSPRNLSMQLSAEAGELLALFLWSSDEGPQPPVEGRLKKVEEELADVLISALNLSSRLGIDLAAAVEQKLIQNALKYPREKAYGRLEKYTELDQE